jgi:hypothetical protein
MVSRRAGPKSAIASFDCRNPAGSGHVDDRRSAGGSRCAHRRGTRVFLARGQLLERAFELERGRSRSGAYRTDEPQWGPDPCVGGCDASAVLRVAARNVDGDAGVQRSALAFEHVEPPFALGRYRWRSRMRRCARCRHREITRAPDDCVLPRREGLPDNDPSLLRKGRTRIARNRPGSNRRVRVVPVAMVSDRDRAGYRACDPILARVLLGSTRRGAGAQSGVGGVASVASVIGRRRAPASAPYRRSCVPLPASAACRPAGPPVAGWRRRRSALAASSGAARRHRRGRWIR